MIAMEASCKGYSLFHEVDVLHYCTIYHIGMFFSESDHVLTTAGQVHDITFETIVSN